LCLEDQKILGQGGRPPTACALPRNISEEIGFSGGRQLKSTFTWIYGQFK
jgi:hypothetical protein